MTSLWNISLLGYFLSHIPITLFIDAQAILPASIYPSTVKELIIWYITNFKDPLMAPLEDGGRPAWFRSIVWIEFLLQLPFFFVAIYYLWRGEERKLRVGFVAYGAHVATTLIPILGTFWAEERLILAERLTLVGIYSPYLLIPLALMLQGIFDLYPIDRKEKRK